VAPQASFGQSARSSPSSVSPTPSSASHKQPAALSRTSGSVQFDPQAQITTSSASSGTHTQAEASNKQSTAVPEPSCSVPDGSSTSPPPSASSPSSVSPTPSSASHKQPAALQEPSSSVPVGSSTIQSIVAAYKQPPVTEAQAATAEKDFADLLRAQTPALPPEATRSIPRLAPGFKPSRPRAEYHSDLPEVVEVPPSPDSAPVFRYRRRWAPEVSFDTAPQQYVPAAPVPQSRAEKKTTSRSKDSSFSLWKRPAALSEAPAPNKDTGSSYPPKNETLDLSLFSCNKFTPLPNPLTTAEVVTEAAKALVTLPATEETVVLELPDRVQHDTALTLMKSVDIVAVAVNQEWNKDREVPVPDPPNARIIIAKGQPLKDWKQSVKVWKPAPLDPNDKEPVVPRSPGTQTKSNKKTGGKKTFSNKKAPPPKPPKKKVIDLTKEEEDQHEEESSTDLVTSSEQESHSSDSDFVPPGQSRPPSPPPDGSKPKWVPHSARALNIANLQRKIVWLECVVVQGERFANTELPDVRGHIKHPEAMTVINLLCVLEHEPVSCELELVIRAGLAGIAQQQVLMELLANQINPKFQRRIIKFQTQTEALKTKFLNNHNARFYARAELGAREIITMLYGTTMGLHEKVVTEQMDACYHSTFIVLNELTALLPKVRETLTMILTTPIPVRDNTPIGTDTK
jgi:hypothetical protein